MYNPNPLLYQQEMAASLKVLRESMTVSAIQINNIVLDPSTPTSTETEKVVALTNEEIETLR